MIAEKYAVDYEFVRAKTEFRVKYGESMQWFTDVTVDNFDDKKQIVKAILEGR
jgi:hypothetical protein